MHSDPVMAVMVGVVAGSVARLYMLRIDYRMYPSYPQGAVIHLTFGLIASFLGALAVPALVAKDFAAASFLALAASQFREVRTVERETLANMESTELVPRGTAYIEGIARVFEARNYLALATALISTTLASLLPLANGYRWLIALIVGFLLPVLFHGLMRGLTVGDVADVKLADITFAGPILTVAGVQMMNVGLPSAREKYRQHGMALLVAPRDPDAKATLANLGQRQAIAHEIAGQLGVRKDIDEPEYTPIVRRNTKTGTLSVVAIPGEKSEEALMMAVRRVPLLEGARRRPLASRAGQIAD